MPKILTENLIKIISEDETKANIATLDEDGSPYTVPSPFIGYDGNGKLIHLELLETSTTHRNILRSLWFDKPVTVTIQAADDRTYVIKNRVFKAYVSGPEFSRHYSLIRQKLDDADLAAVWLLEPYEVIEETYSVRKAREEELHPFHKHLDRLAVVRN